MAQALAVELGPLQTAGVATIVTVTALDGGGATVSLYRGTVHFTTTDGLATLPADYTFTAGDSGLHAFTLTLRTASSTATVTVTDTVTSSIAMTSSATTVASGPVIGLTVTGLGATTAAGSAQSITVSGRDAFGNLVQGYAGSVHFTSNDPVAIAGAGLPSDYAFTGTDAGIHAFAAGVTLRTAGSRTVTATDNLASGVNGAQNTTVLCGPASAFALGAIASPQVAGVATSVSVTARDASGNVSTIYSGTVHFTSTDGAATLPADYTFGPGDSGAHVFLVTFRTAGSISINVADTSGAPITGQSGITVAAGPATQLAVTGVGPTLVAGVPTPVTVTARDAFGNTAPTYTGRVLFTASDPGVSAGSGLPGDYTFTGPGGDAGVHVFAGVFLERAGPATVTATDTVVPAIAGTESGISVLPAPTSQLSLAGVATPLTVNTPATVRVEAQDRFGNATPSYSGTLRFGSSDPIVTPGTGLPADYAFTIADAGSHTFPGAVVLQSTGARIVSATDTVTPSIAGRQLGIQVNALPPLLEKVVPFPQPMDFESYADTVALSASWVPTVSGTDYVAALQLANDATGKALQIDFTLGTMSPGEVAVTFTTPPGTPHDAWDMSSVEALAVSARAEGGPVVVTALIYSLDSSAALGQTGYLTRFEVAATATFQTCYIPLRRLAYATFQADGATVPDLKRISAIKLVVDGGAGIATSLILDDLRFSTLPADFPPITGRTPAGDTQYVVVTFDDCGSKDGMDWVRSELQAVGLTGKATLFLTTIYGDSDFAAGAGFDYVNIRAIWNQFAADGCELANHTHTHLIDPMTNAPGDGTTLGYAGWLTELQTAHDQIVQWTGVVPTMVRAARLETSEDFYKAVEALGYRSDSSLEVSSDVIATSWPHNLRYGPAPDAETRFLPNAPWVLQGGVYVHQTGPQYYLHRGAVGRHAILELALAEWTLASDNATSFVENLCYTAFTPTAPTTWQAAAQIIKDNFDRHYDGDRAPFHLGSHPAGFVFDPLTAGTNGETIDWQGRRLILDDVLRYIASKPGVVFVKASELLDRLGTK